MTVEFNFAVFDCDGVILDTNRIKTRAFRHALATHPVSDIDSLIDFHVSHGGVSRYEKFRYFFETIQDDFDQLQYDKALRRFEQYCEEHVFNADFVPGVEQYIKYLKERNVRMFVVSGADQDELRAVLKHKSIDDQFEEILGSPVTKRENLAELINGRGLSGNGIFFGDAYLDYQIAAEQQLEFIFVYGVSDWVDGRDFCVENRIQAIADFRAADTNIAP